MPLTTLNNIVMCSDVGHAEGKQADRAAWAGRIVVPRYMLICSCQPNVTTLHQYTFQGSEATKRDCPYVYIPTWKQYYCSFVCSHSQREIKSDQSNSTRKYQGCQNFPQTYIQYNPYGGENQCIYRDPNTRAHSLTIYPFY